MARRRNTPAGKHPRFKGWPRRKISATVGVSEPASSNASRTEERKLPNLWIGGENQLADDWTTFVRAREVAACRDKQCVVCGEKIEGVPVFGRYFRSLPGARYVGTRDDNWYSRHSDGPWGHPRCIHLAVNACPHFERWLKTSPDTDNTIVAYVHVTEENPYKDALWHSGDYRVPEDALALTKVELAALAKEAPMGVVE